MRLPILSVVVPIYNMSKYLERCLSSFLISNSHDLEVILVNDGSTDNSLEIISNFLRKNKNINAKIINKNNEGYGPTIKKGILNANGKYLKILDADDFFNVNNLDAHLIFLRENNADLVVTNFIRNYKDYSSTWNLQKNSTNIVSDDLVLSEFQPIEMSDLINMHNITINNKLIKKLLENFDFPKKVFFTDALYSVICYMNSIHIKYQDIILYNYSLDIDGQTMSDNLDLNRFLKMTTSYSCILQNLNNFYNCCNSVWKDALYLYLCKQFEIYINRSFFFLYKNKFNKGFVCCDIKKDINLYSKYAIKQDEQVRLDWLNFILCRKKANLLVKKYLLYKSMKQNNLSIRKYIFNVIKVILKNNNNV